MPCAEWIDRKIPIVSEVLFGQAIAVSSVIAANAASSALFVASFYDSGDLAKRHARFAINGLFWLADKMLHIIFYFNVDHFHLMKLTFICNILLQHRALLFNETGFWEVFWFVI